MTEKEKQIEEMAYDVCFMGTLYGNADIKNCEDCGESNKKECLYLKMAKIFFVAGYRKQSEVAKEFVAGVTVELNKRRDSELYGKDSILGIINKVAVEFGVELEDE